LTATVIRGVGSPSGTYDLAFADGVILASPPPASATTTDIDGAGLVAVPRLTDSHLHLDKTLLGPTWVAHRPGASIDARIALEADALADPGLDPTFARACRLVDMALGNGSTRLRSHVDITAGLGLSRLDALLAVRDAYAGRLDLSFVAFPQAGILASPGTAALLEAALERGVEAIGGLDPTLRDGDLAGHLDVVFGLAVKYGVRVDIHLHEPGELGTSTMREIARRTIAADLNGRVAISHGYALSMVDQAELTRTATALVAADVSLITNIPGGGRVPPVEALTDLGLNVVFGSDNVRDSWSPYGKADMLERVGLAGYLFEWDDDARLLGGLARVTSAPSRTLGDPPALLRPGDPADFTLVPATSLQTAIVSQPAGRVVYRRGAIVAGAGQAVGPSVVSAVQGSGRLAGLSSGQ
jgi:cytosine deaminase